MKRELLIEIDCEEKRCTGNCGGKHLIFKDGNMRNAMCLLFTSDIKYRDIGGFRRCRLCLAAERKAKKLRAALSPPTAPVEEKKP